MHGINGRLLNLCAGLIVFALSVGLFVVGRSILLPFFIAVIICYMIGLLTKAIEDLPKAFFTKNSFSIPRFVSFPLALLAIFFSGMILFDVLSANISSLAANAPAYQARLERALLELTQKFGLEDELRLSEMFPNMLPRAVSEIASAVTTVAGFGALVLVYTLLLLLEYATFDKKLTALFPDPSRARFVFKLRNEIAARVRHYVQIKTAASLITGLLTGLFLAIYGLPYATLFGFLTFLLNYIPTIGSIIAVIFPCAFALVFFDSLLPFFIISIVLTGLQFCIGSILEPRFMGHMLNISPLVIIFALAFWGKLWGVTGMVLCVPLTVVLILISAQFLNTRPIAILLSKDGRVDENFESSPCATSDSPEGSGGEAKNGKL